MPANNSDTGLDLAQRMRFDLAFVFVQPSEQWRVRADAGRLRCELSADFDGVLRGIEPSMPAARFGAGFREPLVARRVIRREPSSQGSHS